jgi:hypothetical protein
MREIPDDPHEVHPDDLADKIAELEAARTELIYEVEVVSYITEKARRADVLVAELIERGGAEFYNPATDELTDAMGSVAAYQFLFPPPDDAPPHGTHDAV